MKCQLIQTTKIDDSNRAEKEMLAFLSNLPAEYFVYRELKLTPSYYERVRGVEQKQPDFVVVAPEIALLSIEVKDWNLTANTYAWQDQNEIRVTRADGSTKTIPNPVVQMQAYGYAFIELLRGLHVFVDSVLAFPRVSRQEFLNRLENIALLQNPQSKYFLNLERTIFKEDLDRSVLHPETFLQQLVRKHPKFSPSTPQAIEQVNQRILPNSFRIGDYTKRQANQNQLKMITRKQEQWIFDLRQDASYLLDVAGSGKTNALISKAIHLVDTTSKHTPLNILLTTYNHNLEQNIRRIFHHKIPPKEHERYRQAIMIQSIPALMEEIVRDYYHDVSYSRGTNESQEDYEKRLKKEIVEILAAEPDQYRRFDYVFIDEIQDFDNAFLMVAKSLCKSNHFFFVGDIGQKIYERSYDIQRMGIHLHDIELPKTYQMFRTPKYIAELATSFMLKDVRTRKDLEAHGYTEQFQYPNLLDNAAVILQTFDLEKDIVEKVQSLLQQTYSEEDILLITSEAKLQRIQDALHRAHIRYILGESESGNYVSLVDFMNVKGLEKEVVLISGIEDLYERTQTSGVFEDEGRKLEKERFSRRKVYVALTRPLEALFIYYTAPYNPFVAELLTINQDIYTKRIGKNHGIRI